MTPAQADRIERLARVLEMMEDGALDPPGTDEQIDALEGHLGRQLPPEVRAIYRLASRYASQDYSGVDLAQIHDGRLDVVADAPQLREWGWNIPEEVVVIGGDGGGRVYGLWLPEEGARRHPVLLLDTGGREGPKMGIVAEDLPALLAGSFALTYLTHWPELTLEIQEALGVPPELRGDPDDRIPAGVSGNQAEELSSDPILRWASPHMPEVASDIYRGTTVADVHRAANRP